MNVEYCLKAEQYDIYTIIGCSFNDSRETIKANAKQILKECHPDKTSTEFESEFFLLVNYAYKILTNPLLRTIYNYEGHIGLKIFNNNREIFEQILNKYHIKALDDEKDENFNEAVDKVMKKIRKIKFELIKTNLHKYTNDKQKLNGEINFSKFFNKVGKFENKYFEEEKVIDDGGNLSNNKEEFIKLISQSTQPNNPTNSKVSLEHNRFSSFPAKELICLSSISIGHETDFNFLDKTSEITNIKLKLSSKYCTNVKNVVLYPKIMIFKHFLFINKKIITQFNINTSKHKIKAILDFPKVEKFPILQMPFVKSQYNYKKRNLNISIGNKYEDEAIKLKTSYVLPTNKIKFYLHTFLKDAYNSIIGFKLSGLKKFIFFYKGILSQDVEVHSKTKIGLNRKFNFIFSGLYKISQKFKMGITSDIELKSGLTLNVISVGLYFKTFKIMIPICISRIENFSTFKEILFANVVINGIVYSIHLFKELLF